MGGSEVIRHLSRYGASRIKNAVLISAVTPYLLKTVYNPDDVDQEVFDEIEARYPKGSSRVFERVRAEILLTYGSEAHGFRG